MYNDFDNTEEKIIKATFKLLQSEGSGKSTTKKIAAEAGVNEVTIFRKFKNKNNLIEITKDYYIHLFVQKLEKVFRFKKDEEIGKYLNNAFNELINFSEDDFSILKVAMEEVREVPDRKQLLSEITNAVLNKLEQFFQYQLEIGTIRDIDPRVLAVMCFSIIFQSLILKKVYGQSPNFETNYYSENILDILFNGIKH